MKKIIAILLIIAIATSCEVNRKAYMTVNVYMGNSQPTAQAVLTTSGVMEVSAYIWQEDTLVKSSELWSNSEIGVWLDPIDCQPEGTVILYQGEANPSNGFVVVEYWLDDDTAWVCEVLQSEEGEDPTLISSETVALGGLTEYVTTIIYSNIQR